MFFWVLALYVLVDKCKHLGETYCLNLQGWSLSPSSLNMETLRVPETSAFNYQSAWRQNPEDIYYVIVFKVCDITYFVFVI
jgi:hypothetical protein